MKTGMLLSLAPVLAAAMTVFAAGAGERAACRNPDSPVRVLAELDVLNAYERIRSCYINIVETLAGGK